MKVTEGFALREVAGEQVLMPAGENISRFEGAIILSEVAAFAYQKMAEHPEGMDIQEIAEAISEVYEVDTKTAKADIAEVIEELKGYGAVAQ